MAVPADFRDALQRLRDRREHQPIQLVGCGCIEWWHDTAAAWRQPRTQALDLRAQLALRYTLPGHGGLVRRDRPDVEIERRHQRGDDGFARTQPSLEFVQRQRLRCGEIRDARRLLPDERRVALKLAARLVVEHVEREKRLPQGLAVGQGRIRRHAERGKQRAQPDGGLCRQREVAFDAESRLRIQVRAWRVRPRGSRESVARRTGSVRGERWYR